MIKKYVYIAFALLILVMNWEVQKNEAVVAAPVIPEEAIRLRILANSDTARDQWLKRQVRDDIVDYMQQLTGEMHSFEAARELIADHVSEIERRTERIVEAYGFTYDVDVHFGQVPFPTKLYGNQVYPAGHYEAVKISLGSGTGANWWCVLFPPLCFVDMTNADAVPKSDEHETDQVAEDQADDGTSAQQDESDQLEVRFFLVDWFHNLIETIKNVFNRFTEAAE